MPPTVRSVVSAAAVAALALLPALAAPAGTTYFLSNDRLYCAEGAPRPAEAALALYKAGPSGGYYNESAGVSGTCAGAGFAVSTGSDQCAPEVVGFVRSAADLPKAQAQRQASIDAFARHNNISSAVARLMSQCTCAPGSDDMAAAQGKCASGLAGWIGAWVHRDPFNRDAQLICDEGPFVFATRALAVLKSSPQLPMHFRDQISPLGCPALGFPLRFPPADHCFTFNATMALHIYTKTKDLATDPGILESVATEQRLTGNYR